MGLAADWSLELEAERSRRFRKLLLYSALAHIFVISSMMLSPRPIVRPALPAVVEVQLHAALPSSAAPPPEPIPEQPKPEPPPPPVAKPKPPVPEKVVLPEEPKPLPKPKPKPKPKAKPKPVAKKPDPKPPPETEESYDDFLASLRAERAAKAPPGPPTAVARGPRGPTGPGIVLPPEVVGWMRQAKVHVTRAWVLAPNFRTLPLETEIAVRVDRSGAVRATRITRRSGNPWFDESVERAIRKASPLPPPPEAEEWSFIFRPEDLL
ncbi:MAG: TonB family protein [Myxococcota bacterium]|nr:TonB family protein [Myxococcota bacterium]